ncbi:MmcQ/YjbR family DNA-binding protein, partial [bacterium]
MNLAQVRKRAMALPEVTEEAHFDRTSFRVKGKIFVTAKPDEPYVHVFVSEDVREPALASHPEHLEKLSWGGKVVGLRIALTGAPVGVVN